jgi:hypothetical protein
MPPFTISSRWSRISISSRSARKWTHSSMNWTSTCQSGQFLGPLALGARLRGRPLRRRIYISSKCRGLTRCCPQCAFHSIDAFGYLGLISDTKLLKGNNADSERTALEL